MTQRGREPYTEGFTVRLSPSDFVEFQELADDKGVGRAILAREVLREYIKMQREKRRQPTHQAD